MTFRYRNSSGAHTFDIDLGQSVVRLGSITSGFADRAELGEPGTGGLELDDPGGVLDILPLQYIVVVESDCSPTDNVVHIGLINDERIARGDASRSSLRVGADRVWSLDLEDPNEFLALRLLHSFSRPAETASARLTALLAVSNCPVHDHGLVVYPTHAMDKNDYTWQSFQDVLSDIAAAAGYNYFAYYSQPTGDFGLFFDDPDSSAYTSTAKISNVLADLGAGVYAPIEGTTTLVRSPSRIASTAVVQYAGGYQTYYDSATADLYTAIDRVAPSSNVKTAAKALAVATKYQRASSTYSDRVTTTIRMPRASVNDIRAGHRMQVTFSHLPGWETIRWARVMSRTVLQPEETDQTYQVTLELTPQTTYTAASYFVGTGYGSGLSGYNGFNPHDQSLWASDDGVTYHQVLSSSALIAAAFTSGGNTMVCAPISSAEARHRFWQLRFSYSDGTGGFHFNAGLFNTCCHLIPDTSPNFRGFLSLDPNPGAPGDWYIPLSDTTLWKAWVAPSTWSTASNTSVWAGIAIAAASTGTVGAANLFDNVAGGGFDPRGNGGSYTFGFKADVYSGAYTLAGTWTVELPPI